MDLRQLAALVAVADTGGFSAAADSLHTVQSNVSSHVARLERELGVALVDRQGGRLTEEGAVVVARARRITGELEGVTFEELSYEGYGPGGVAIIVDALTDNRNRLVSELRLMFSRHGGNLSETGSVGWMFKKHGVITIEKKATDEDKLLEIALDAGADDVSSDGDSFQVTTPPEKLHAVRDTIEKAGIAIGTAELTRIPENTVAVSGHTAEQVLKLLEALEDHDDIQSVSANFDISDQELAQISAAS